MLINSTKEPSTNDIEPLSLTLHAVNGLFSYQPSNVKNNSIGIIQLAITLRLVNQKKKC